MHDSKTDTHGMTDSGADLTSPRAKPVYRLDDLVVDVGTAQARRGDQLIPLPRLSFDLLLSLIKAAPNLVTVDELMTQVWPGVVVNAETVSQRVKLLRVALEDDPKQPRYIAVSRGRGYRIVGQVTTIEAAEATATATTLAPSVEPAATATSVPTSAPAEQKRWTSRWAIAAIAIIVLLAGLTALFFLPRTDPPAATTPLSLPDRSVAVLRFDTPGQSTQDTALAFGVAETLLHRLSASSELTVIARQSSFSFAPHNTDVREIGRKLNARFIVEGSLQSTPDRLRITAQLIDANTGAHVWSLQFDRKPQDIFVIQDEIAAKVTDALRITLAGTALAQEKGTQDFDAYLAYTQGRTRLATQRVADAKLAIADFERAVQLDPKFARAYADLAQAHLYVAHGTMSRDRQQLIEKSSATAEKFLQRALEINEFDSDAHLQLANMYWEGDRAEKELQRALALNPNSAPGYQLLASMRMFRDNRPDEAMVAIDKARTLHPLETLYDNEKAMIALYGKSDVQLAEQLSLSVLARDPSSTAALWRLGEIYWCCRAEYARGIKYLEQALERDPDFEFGRRILIRAYLDVDDLEEARAVVASAPNPVEVRLVPLLVASRDWVAAAARTYEEDRLGTSLAIDAANRVFAVRMQARLSGKYEPAKAYLTKWATVTWAADGSPEVAQTGMSEYIVGLTDMLMQSGERERAQKLVDALLKSIDDEARVRNRGELWYLRSLSVLYAMLGRDDDALTMLEKCVAQDFTVAMRQDLADDPAYLHLHSHPRYRAVVEQVERNAVAQRAQLDQMRAKGLVPHRSRR